MNTVLIFEKEKLLEMLSRVPRVDSSFYSGWEAAVKSILSISKQMPEQDVKNMVDNEYLRRLKEENKRLSTELSWANLKPGDLPENQ